MRDDDDDNAAIRLHNHPRPARKARASSSTTKRPRTAAPMAEIDEAEVALHRTAVASLDPEERGWFGTQAIFFVARGGTVEQLAGVWAFPHETMRYGYVDNAQGDMEYCVMLRLRGSSEFIQVSTGIVRLSSGTFVEASRNPVLDSTMGYVLRILSIEKVGMTLPSVAFIDGRVSDALHMDDVVRRHASSFSSTSDSFFAVGRRTADRTILQRLAAGEATSDDLQAWADKHRHPWEVSEAIECDGPDEFLRSIETMVKDIDLDDTHVVCMERIPSSNVGIIPALWATQQGNRSTWIPAGRLWVRFVNKHGFQLLPIA